MGKYCVKMILSETEDDDLRGIYPYDVVLNTSHKIMEPTEY